MFILQGGYVSIYISTVPFGMSLRGLKTVNLPIEQEGEPAHPGKELCIAQGLDGSWEEPECLPDICKCMIPWSMRESKYFCTPYR
jgi:hypothetical protein